MKNKQSFFLIIMAVRLFFEKIYFKSMNNNHFWGRKFNCAAPNYHNEIFQSDYQMRFLVIFVYQGKGFILEIKIRPSKFFLLKIYFRFWKIIQYHLF